MRSASTLALALALFSSASAHFTLDYPLTRGFDEDLESQNFCGGFATVLTPRQPWYYRNGPISIDSHHDSATVNIYISYDTPTSAQSFLSTNGVSVPPLRHDLAITGQGEFCFHANASGVEGVRVGEGTNATIMVEFISNVHGHLYQCSDVVFTEDAGVGKNITCTDALTAATTSGGEGASSTAASSTAASSATAAASTPKSNSNGGVLALVPTLGLATTPVLLLGILSLV